MAQGKPDELALTISGWPLSFDNEQVVAVLKDVCDVTECELLKPEAGAEGLAAIVHFADAESADKAAENVHGLGVSAHQSNLTDPHGAFVKIGFGLR
jgi:hypothetical protein